MSQAPTQQYQQQIIAKGVILLLGGLVASLLLVSRFSRNIIETGRRPDPGSKRY